MVKLKNVHPGEVLLNDFLEPLGISQNKLANRISVPPRRINEIVLGKRSITADTALRLSRYFGNSDKFWMGLQDDYDLEDSRNKIAGSLEKIASHAKRRAAGLGGRAEVRISGRQRLDTLTRGGGRATEAERSGSSVGLHAATGRLKSSKAPQKVSQVPQSHAGVAASVMRKAGVSGTAKNMGGIKRRYVHQPKR